MSKNPAKDFGPIADDYAFFETHATEAANDSEAYVERLAGSVLDFVRTICLDVAK